MSDIIVRLLQSSPPKGVAALTATALFFSGIDNIALVSQTVTPSGGVAPYSFVAVNFPAGVTVGAASGIVSGTPTSPGNTTNASVTVTDSAAHTFSVPIFFAIATGTFIDTFHRADQPFYVGDQWAVQPLTFSTCLGPNIAAAINVAANQLNLSICSSNGANGLLLFPIPISWDVIFGRSQYAQMSMTADNSGGANFAFCGPSCMVDGNKTTGYFIQTNTNGAANTLKRYVVTALGVGNINTNGGAGFTYAFGDILRIEALPNTPAVNQTTVKTYINGVQQSSDIDAVGHYSFGNYGILDYFISAGITQSFDNFQGGAL